MADNVNVLDSVSATKAVATDELSDSSHSPKVSVLAGDGTTAPISPATSGKQDTQITHLASIANATATDDSSTHSPGVTTGVPIMAAATPTDSAVNANDLGVVAMTLNRNLHVSVQDALPAGDQNIGNVDIATVNGASWEFGPGVASGFGAARVILATDDPAVTALEIMDDWDESDRAKVNPIVGQAGVAAGSGTVSALTQRVVLATDVALPAGTNAIGKLAANSGVDIGDVDVTSIAAGDNNIGNVDIVTVPTDPFGANADAASASGSISAKLRGIATALGITALDLGSGTSGSRTLRWFHDTAQWIGGSGVVGTAVQRVTLATDVALPAGTNAIGKLAANSGVDIGDVDVTSIATGTNAIGRVGHDTTGLGHGVTTVTTAGTDVALAGSTACKWVTVQAQTDNTNIIAVGATGVDATIATGNGIILNPGDVITLPIDNLADVFIDSLVNGEGVRYTYGT